MTTFLKTIKELTLQELYELIQNLSFNDAYELWCAGDDDARFYLTGKITTLVQNGYPQSLRTLQFAFANKTSLSNEFRSRHAH
jgi:hypothetical protein